ncbi:MAG TPA: hypothetical protein VKX17_23200 [Planctomycetota bacterium]|nr:hypothetical protein [Planctomycetota bacterium]
MLKLQILCLAAVMLAFNASAMGNGNGGNGGGGKGRTKIQFQFDTSSTANSQFFAKIDVSAALSQLGNSGTKSHNDDLAGYTLTLTIGSATFSGVADAKGKITANSTATPPVPFSAKLTANGKILQIMANGWDLKTLLGVDTTKTSGQVTVEIDVSASKTDSTSGQTMTVALSTQSVTFNYSVKGTTVKGKNF